MKKLNLAASFSKGEVLTKAQLKKVLGGDGSASGSGGTCDDWATKPKLVCFNCCITVRGYDECASKCGY